MTARKTPAKPAPKAAAEAEGQVALTFRDAVEGVIAPLVNDKTISMTLGLGMIEHIDRLHKQFSAAQAQAAQ